MLYASNKYKLTYQNTTLFLSNGKAFYRALEQLINTAKSYIHFQVYIFNEDETGKHIASLLQQAAQRYVKIHLVLDAYGSNGLSTNFINYLKSFCTTFKFFSPLFIKYTINVGLRMHHKIFTADGRLAILGGVNIANKYSGINYQHQWLDFGIQIEGPAVIELEKICLKTINRNPLQKKILNVSISEPTLKGNTKVRILQNDRYRNKIGITRAYRNHIRNSKSEILIISSYFLPSNSFRRLLKNAARRNVKIKLILGAQSDTKMVLFATRYFYKTLLKFNIEIYEWQQSVLHGKLAVFDKKITTIGSYNLNALSDFGSLECNAEVYDETFSNQVLKTIENDVIKHCYRVDTSIYSRKYGLVSFIINKMSYHLLIFLLNFLFLLQAKNANKILPETESNEY